MAYNPYREPPPSPQKRARRYYLETIVFQVEDVLFKVPKWYFTKHSSIFRDMFSVPAPRGLVVEGSDDDHPIILEGVKIKDFEAVIGLMYPMPTHNISGTCEYPGEPEKIEDKIMFYSSILELSRRWFFHGLHAYAIKRLEVHIDPFDKVVLGQRFDIPAWICSGYRDLVNRGASITEEEAGRLGWSSTLKIFRLRENRLLAMLGWRELRPVELPVIQEEFSEELLQADHAYTEFYADGITFS